MKTFFVAVRAILYASGFVLFWGWLASGARRYDARMGFELPSWSGGVGVLLVIAGGLLVLACIWNFIVRGRGTPAPFDPPTVFVATGPYRYVRNPMYIGAAIFLAGYGLFTRSVSIALLPLPLLIAAHVFVLLVEEPGLTRRFGESYRVYKQTVNRWLPRFSAWRPVGGLSS